MTKKEIIIYLLQYGYNVTARKNSGSMKKYTTFKLKGDKYTVNKFSDVFQVNIKKLFPVKDKQTGCFTSWYQIDILNDYIF